MRGLAILGQRDGEGCTPVQLAAQSSMQLENLKLMLKHAEGRAALNVTDIYMKTPLHWAVAVGNTEGVEAMLQYEQVRLILHMRMHQHAACCIMRMRHQPSWTKQHIAECLGRKISLEQVSRDANTSRELHIQAQNALKLPDNEGHTPVHLAAKKGYADLLQIMIKHIDGLRALRMTDNRGQTPLHLAMDCCIGSSAEAAEILLHCEEVRFYSQNTVMYSCYLSFVAVLYLKFLVKNYLMSFLKC